MGEDASGGWNYSNIDGGGGADLLADDVARPELPFLRHPVPVVVGFSIVYAAVFLLGLFGNLFVLLAVASHQQLRTITDYLIASLAAADCLIIVFCLPATLWNNVITEWLLGSFACKFSTWLNATTSCASVYTLVAVTADRYVAICHTLKHSVWDTRQTSRVIAVIWLLSALQASPNFVNYAARETNVTLDDNGTLALMSICASSPSVFEFERIYFVVINLFAAFLAPFLLISVCYTLIFAAVTRRRGLAVDARVRDERVRLRVTHMMLTVILIFVACWTPLYSVYCYFFFFASPDDELYRVAAEVLRPLFQWLSLLSSSLNPVIYVLYSRKYRAAFKRLLSMACSREGYEKATEIQQQLSKKRSTTGLYTTTYEYSSSEHHHHRSQRALAEDETTATTTAAAAARPSGSRSDEETVLRKSSSNVRAAQSALQSGNVS